MLSPIKVLVVEDNLLNQKTYKALLEAKGIIVDFADNGVDGIHAVANGDYNVVLMDIRLPQLDGMEATRTIRALRGPKSKIPVIAVTAHAMTGDREKYLDAGMNDYLSKPVLSKALIEAVHHWATEQASNEAA